MQNTVHPSSADSDGRCLRDRRRRPALLHYRAWGFGGRRKTVRRALDTAGGYLDFYPAGLLYAALAILVLSALDAALTLNLLQLGAATEANAIMAALLEKDVGLFINTKIAITALGLAILVVHAHFAVFRRLRVQLLIHGMLAMYAALIVYELTLLWLAG